MSATAVPQSTEEGLQRRLKPRQLTMIAIGGAIGVGLFLGSTVTIGLAGPGVIITYLIGAVIALIMAYALAEMAVVHPLAGSFGVYAERYLSPWFGFIVRATYGFIQILAIGAEVTAIAIYAAFWFPAVPAWLWVAAVSVLLVLLNTSKVSRFGEVEYRFSLIKVVAILAFIVVGLMLVFGGGTGEPVGLTNLTDGPGGFLPHGWTGVWLALTLVITSYMGVEVIAVTAGEAERPEESIPRAMRTMVFRLIVFYVLAITVMLMMTRWDRIAEGGGGITGSPFVRAFGASGHPFRRQRDEPGGHLGGAVERQHQPLHDHPHAVLAGEVGTGAGVAGDHRSERRAPPRRLRRQSRHAGGHRPGHLLTRSGVSRAVRDCRRRYAVHLGGDSLHLHRASAGR